MDMQFHNPTTANPALVIAPHCSGAAAGQWRQPGTVLDARCQLVAPIMAAATAQVRGVVFMLSPLRTRGREPSRSSTAPVAKLHLVGHSCGGDVALHAHVERANRFANLVLNKPSAFQLLKEMGARGVAALAEMLASKTAEGMITGDYSGAAISFVDYWGGRAWTALRLSVQAVLTR